MNFLKGIIHLDHSFLIPLVAIWKDNALFLGESSENERYCGGTVPINKVLSKFY